jgi:hypothetical protein
MDLRQEFIGAEFKTERIKAHFLCPKIIKIKK